MKIIIKTETKSEPQAVFDYFYEKCVAALESLKDFEIEIEGEPKLKKRRILES